LTMSNRLRWCTFLFALLCASLGASWSARAAGGADLSNGSAYVTIGADGKAWLVSVDNNGVATVAEETLAHANPLQHITMVLDTAGNLDVVAVDSAGTFLFTVLHHTASGASWPNPGNWQVLPALHLPVISDLTLVALDNNGVAQLHLFVYATVAGQGTRMWHLQANNGAFMNWDQASNTNPPQQQLNMKPVAIVAAGGVEALVKPPGNQAFQGSFYNGAGWAAWAQYLNVLPESILGNVTSIVFTGTPGHLNGIGKVLVFRGAQTGTMYLSSNNGPWIPIGQPPGTPGGSPLLVTDTTSALATYVIELNGGIWHQNELQIAPLLVNWQLATSTFPLMGELTAAGSSRIFYDLPADNMPTTNGALNRPDLAVGTVMLQLTAAPEVASSLQIPFPSAGGPSASPWNPPNNPNDTAQDVTAILQQGA